MSIFDKPHRLTKVFHRLGIWSIPLLATPLLLPLVLLQSLLPSSEEATSSIDPAAKQFSTSPSATLQSYQQLVNQRLVAANSSIAKTHAPKSQSQTPQKPLVKAQKKHAAAAKKRTPKSAAKPHYTAPALEIRVAIADGATNLAIGSSTSANILDANGKVLKQLPASQSLQAQPSDSALLLGDQQLPPVVWIQPKKNGYVYVGDHWYRGRVLLVSQSTTLLAVNYVDLEHYLYSVVGSEMSAGAPLEALKAQAIAARSYALVHLFRPASDWYNLGANERWQAYKGLDGEYNTTHQAVKETGGQILSYQGEIFESLYAASEAIVDKAHSGVGMSQTGAYKLATQGYNYQQILGVYYPGKELRRLELKR